MKHKIAKKFSDGKMVLDLGAITIQVILEMAHSQINMEQLDKLENLLVFRIRKLENKLLFLY